MRRPLRKYQKPMLKYCLSTDNPALFVQMRLGKTLVTIRSCKIRGNKKILVVAPYSALYGWLLELIAERYSEDSIIEVFGSGKDRRALLDATFETAQWFLFNKEGHRIFPEIADYPFDCVIVDESTFIKSPAKNSKGTKKPNATKFYCENFREANNRYILTGTPAPESELEYYSQLQFLDRKIWREKNFWEFRHKNFAMINYTPYLSPSGSKYLANTLAKNCMFLTRYECKVGGKKIYQKRKIILADKFKKIYNKIEKEFVLEYMKQEQETIYATTKYVWLRRLCGGFIDQEFVSYAKIKEVESLLKTELKNEQVIIIAKHINEVKKLTKYLSKDFAVGMVYGAVTKKKRPAIYQAFQDGNLDLIIAQAGCISHGTNLSASDTVIFYTTPDGGETREQVEDRVVNTATNDSSLIIDLIFSGTVEEDVIGNLRRKEGRQALMRRIVKRLTKKYRIAA